LTPADISTVQIYRCSRGGWEVDAPGSGKHVRCDSLEDARRLGHLWATRRCPCELIVRDAYHRVIGRELIDGAGGPAAS